MLILLPKNFDCMSPNRDILILSPSAEAGGKRRQCWPMQVGCSRLPTVHYKLSCKSCNDWSKSLLLLPEIYGIINRAKNLVFP